MLKFSRTEKASVFLFGISNVALLHLGREEIIKYRKYAMMILLIYYVATVTRLATARPLQHLPHPMAIRHQTSQILTGNMSPSS